MPKTRKKIDGNYFPSEDGEPQHADSDSSSGSQRKHVTLQKAAAKREQNRKRSKAFRQRIANNTATPKVKANYEARENSKNKGRVTRLQNKVKDLEAKLKLEDERFEGLVRTQKELYRRIEETETLNATI